MRALHEVDLSQQTFRKIPSKSRIASSIPILKYHLGVFDDGEREPFKVLLVFTGEANHLKKNAIPVNDITDAEHQLHTQNAASVRSKAQKMGILPTGFVQDTPGARMVLKEGGFKKDPLMYRVTPDIDLML
ncbi:hypothetical protein HY031_03020 [Candidatus Gottesmanbacteria bacterium]|nr:hypothetical protein [Candidatus Gottesmanbacteria bacterium]